MKFNVITLFPEAVKNMLSFGVIGRAVEAGKIQIQYFNPRDWSDNKHRRVDDRPFGGGAGMLMMYDPLYRTLMAIKEQDADTRVVYLSPQGQPLKQVDCNYLATVNSLTLLCGRYEGVDQRFIDRHVDMELSIGDYVISGGELAAAVMVDAVSRQLTGVLGDESSAQSDSFMTGKLGYPQYTRSEILGQSGVPTVLLSGDHKKIASWRAAQALAKTKQQRPDLMAGTSEGK
ncbi:tRNA (guanosine(37)-N1)-methyltransferase TrmD [Marinicella gelatinilytica]|uniref:tRNA (guanosine(37)-N1)-methyltransferase TrmD n=1 Tax=Marinicella gelatinilytica TaxID=2996017 RepID=UPI002260F0CE|nr:tRNA (guanosine(37)-N1)-methyltransferase TrmD [Marinicella gelatinilytica]MCX7544298.1 tRNA (guanosine(37)-N1)-methyltransferase TrmD [Marinicella gelatinilytica]